MHFSKILSLFTGATILALLLLVLKPSTSEIGEQVLYLCNITKVLFLLTILQLIVDFKKLKIGITDIAVISSGIYLYSNYVFRNPNVIDTTFAILGLLFIIYICIRVYCNGNYLRNTVFYAFVISGIFVSVLALKQILGLATSNHTLFKATATFYNPGQLGGYLALIISGLLPYLVNENTNLNRYLQEKNVVCLIKYISAAVAFLLSLTLLPSTGSRAAFMALFVVAIAYTTINYGKKFLSWVKGHKIISIIGTLIIISVFILGYTSKEGSANGRMLIWKVSLQNTEKKDLLFGVGSGNFAGKYGEYQEKYFAENKHIDEISVADAPEFAFNEYVQIFVEYGVIGLLLFLSILFFSLKNLYQHKNTLAYPFTALLVFAFFSYPFSLPVFLIILAIFIGIGANYDKKVITQYGYIPLLLLCGVILYFSSTTLNTKLKSVKEWNKLAIFYNMKVYKDLEADYGVLHDNLKDHHKYLFEYGQILSKNGMFRESNLILEEGLKISSDPMFLNIIGNNYKALKEYALADQYYRRSFNRLPNRIYPLYLQMNLYKETNEKDLLRKKAQQILNFKEKVTSTATKEIKAEALGCLNSL